MVIQIERISGLLSGMISKGSMFWLVATTFQEFCSAEGQKPRQRISIANRKKNCASGKFVGVWYIMSVLGVTGSPKMDVFLENSQTAFDPPPRFWKLHCAFFQKIR